MTAAEFPEEWEQTFAACQDPSATVVQDENEIIEAVTAAVWTSMADALDDLGWAYLDNLHGQEVWLSHDRRFDMAFECYPCVDGIASALETYGIEPLVPPPPAQIPGQLELELAP